MPDIFQSTNIINLASKMDSRTSSEYLNIDPDTTSFTFRNLQNADLFNTKALSTRLGTIDLGGGILNSSGQATPIYSLYSGNTQGTVSGIYVQPVFLQPNSANRQGLIINIPQSPTSGITNFVLNGGTILLQDVSSTQNVIEAGYDINIQMYLAEVGAANQTVTTFLDTFTFTGTHNIALSGNFNDLINAPTLNNVSTQNIDATPLAISNTTIVNFGSSLNYVQGNNPNLLSSYATPWIEVPYTFSAPFQLELGTTYYLYIVANNTSGTTSRDIQSQIIWDNKDISPNTIYSYMTTNHMTGTSYYNILTDADFIWPDYGITKAWLSGEVDQYHTPDYTLLEFPNVDYVVPLPISGANLNPDFNTEAIIFSNLTPAPNLQPLPSFTSAMSGVSTTSAEFGQTFTPVTGTYIINGGYIYANTWANTYWKSQARNNTSIDLNDYTTNYVCNLYQILGTTGTRTSGTLTYQTQLLTSYSGNYTFTNPNTYQNPYNNQSLPGAEINSNLQQIQAVFSNPVTINQTGNTQYLLGWQFLNSSNAPITDFETYTQNVEISNNVFKPYYYFQSPILIGFNDSLSGPVSGSFVRREASGFEAYVANDSLSFGVYSFPTGNGIQLVYDFNIGSSRLEKVIIGQNNNLYSCNFDTPEDLSLIFTGSGSSISPNNELLWDATTYSNLMFATQYSESGTQVCWNQIYTQPSGNWTQPWGLQPAFTMYPITGTVASTGSSSYSGQSLGYGLSSGQSVSVLLATQMETGGYRSSTQTFTCPTGSSHVYIGLSGLDIFRISGTSTNSQYFFDVVPQSTYVFVTQAADIYGNPVTGTSPAASGIPATTDTFYLAEILSAPSGLSPICLNPLENSGTFIGTIASGTGTTPNTNGHIYLGNFDANTLTQQIPNVLFYNQAYLDEQIPTPQFKKTVVFFNYIIGVGDPNEPSGFYYCGISPNGLGQPQIWGTDGEVAGFVPIAPNSPQGNSPITGIEVFRDNLFIFTYNAVYRFVYTGNPASPFSRYTMSNVLGSLGFFSTVSTDYGVFFLSQFGPALVSLGPPDTIGDEILPTFQNFDHTNLTFAVALYDRERQQIYWSISNDISSPNNQTGLVYSTATQAWNIRQGAMWLSAGIIFDFDNFNQLWIGTSNGQLQQIAVDDTYTDTIFVSANGNILTQTITLEAETPWLNIGNSETLKRIKNMAINCETSAQQLQIDVYYDQNDTQLKFTRYLTMDNAVIQRYISWGSRPCHTCKLVITSIGEAVPVKLKSIQFTYSDLGVQSQR